MEQDVTELEVLDEGRDDSEELSACCQGASAKK
jgi:putative radical SAM-modified peptide